MIFNELNIYWILFVISLLLTIYFVYKLIKTSKSKEEQKKEITKLGLSFLLTATFFLLGVLIRSDAMKSATPKITANLVIEEIKDKSIKFSFKVSNIGEIDLKNVHFETFSPEFTEFRNDSLARIEYLGSNSTYSYYGVNSMIPSELESKIFVVQLRLWYDAIYKNSTKAYNTDIIFSIPPESFKLISYEPTNIITKEEKYSFYKIKGEVNEIFNRNKGHIVLVFFENQQPSIGKVGILNSTNKSVFYYPITKRILFERYMFNDTPYVEQYLPQTKSGGHIIEIWWNDTLIRLGVDSLNNVESFIKK